MLRRLAPLLVAFPLALSALGCSSLTKPDEIRIVAESINPASAPAGNQPGLAAQPGGGLRALPSAPGGAPGGG
jgi:hypothetical protein